MPEYVVFYKRDANGLSMGAVPIAAISYDENVQIVGPKKFLQSWKPFFTSEEWKKRPEDRKSLKYLFSRAPSPVRFVTKAEFDTAVQRIKAGLQTQMKEPPPSRG